MRPVKKVSPWLLLFALLIGTLLGTMANSMVSMAVSTLDDAFQQPLSIAVYTVSLYTLTMSVLMPVCGSLGGILGHKKIYLGGMLLFTISSILCAVSPTFGWLLAGRILQGVGISTILPTVMALIPRLFPAEQNGRAVGYWALANGAGHAIGPLLSGFILQYLGWQYIFLVNLPFCLVCIYLVWRYLPEGERLKTGHFDVLGAVSLTVMALSFMLALTQSFHDGWTSPAAFGLWALSLVSLLTFIIREKYTAEPFVELRLFANRPYTAAIAVVSVGSLSLFGLQVAVPIFLMDIQNVQAQITGVMMLFLSLTMALLGPGAGTLANKIGFKQTCMMGLALVALGASLIYGSRLALPGGVSWWLVALCLIITGIGLGFIQTPTTAAVIRVIQPLQLGIATGIFHMVRFIMGAIGGNAFGLILDINPGGESAGFNVCLVFVLVVSLLGMVFSFWMPGKPATE